MVYAVKVFCDRLVRADKPDINNNCLKSRKALNVYFLLAIQSEFHSGLCYIELKVGVLT